MKKIIVAVLLLIPMLLSSDSASAQGRSYLGVNAGITFPSSPSGFKTYWTTSFNFNVDYEKPVADIFSVGGELSFASFALDKTTTGLARVPTTGGSFNAIQLLAVGKVCEFNSASTVSPYGKLGLGLSLTSFDDLKDSDGDIILPGSSENGLGVMIGVGLNFNLLSGNKVSVEGSYRVNSRPGDSFNAILLDVGYHFSL